MFDYFCGIIAELVIVFLSVIILKVYFGVFFENNRTKIWNNVLWVSYIIWQLIVSRANLFPAYVNVFISIFLVGMICISSYAGNFLQKLVFSVLINTLWMLIEFLVGYMFILRGINIYNLIPQFLGSLISKLLTLLLIVGLKGFFKNENIRNLPKKYNMALLLIPIGSMFVVYNIFSLSFDVNNKHIRSSLTSSLLILLINIVIFKLYLKLSKENELQKYNTIYEQQLELCNRHMREKETIMMDFRNARHDMKQHFIILIEMLDNNEIELATDYLRKLINMKILSNIGISKTDNIVVDSLINAKYSVALKLGIKLEIDIHIPMQLPFESADLSILLGNIFDNAIEASMLISKEKRCIKYFMKYENNMLIITVVNAFTGKLLKNRNGRIVTNKEDSERHGIGLESVRKVAEKYHGSVVIETRQETFIIKTILCDL